MDVLSFSAAELAWLLYTAGPPTVETLKVLGLSKVDMSEPVRNAGFSSLILRGEADTDGDEATIAPTASAVAQGIIDAKTVVQLGFAADGEADGGLLFSSPKLRILIAPRAFDTYDALALDAKESLGKPVAGLAQAFLEDRNPALAAVVVQDPGGSRQYTVAAGEDWTFVDGKKPTNGLSKTAALRLLRDAVGSAAQQGAKRFDPRQPRDGEGQWTGGIPGPATPGLKDTLKLAGKINLDPGENLVASAKVDSDQGGIRMALTDQNGKRMLRLGLGGESYGQRNPDQGTIAWDGNPTPPQLPEAERQRLSDEFDALGDEHDSATPARSAEIDARQAAILEQLEAGDGEFNGTALLDEYGMRRLADRIRPALAEAVEQEKTENRAWDEIEALEAEGGFDPGRMAELRRIARADTIEGITFDEGIIAGSAWGDVHYSVGLHDTSQGPEIYLGVMPKGVPDDWGDARDWQGVFGPAETRKFLRLLDQYSNTGSPKRRSTAAGCKYNEQQLRDAEGQWTTGGVHDYFDMSGLTDVVEAEGNFGDLAMGLDNVGDVRLAFRERGQVREMDLGLEEVAELGDAVERLAGSRDDIPDGTATHDVYDEDYFGGQSEGKVELYGSGVIAVTWGDGEPDPYVLWLDPGNPDDPSDEDNPDDVPVLLGAIDDIMTAADKRGFIAGGDG